jgi:N-acetylglucosaminyl-diphospho-decaprenol L-rhamnosyltransferase
VTGGIDTVIVAYGNESVIEAAVLEARKLAGRIVVVDHGDGTSAKIAARAGATSVANPTNPGFGAGQNHGITRTATPYVLLCNPDAEIVAPAVLAGADYLEAHPRVGAVQGVVVNRSTGAPERSQGVALRPVHLLGRALGARRLLRRAAVRRLVRRSAALRDHAERVPHGPVEVEALAATVLLVRREAFDSVGGFDTRYFLYGEDLDLCRRLRRAGWTLTSLPVVWAVHQSGGSADSPASRELHWWRGTMEYAARWWTSAEWAVAVAAATVRATILALRSPAEASAVWWSLVGAPLRSRLTQPRGS